MVDPAEHKSQTEPADGDSPTWFLKGRGTEDGAVQLIPIDAVPFQIGRRPRLHLTVGRSTVSGLHAEIIKQGNEYWLRDMGSTNGTYVNGEPISTPRALDDGDLIQFADAAFRVCHESPQAESRGTYCAADTTADLAMAVAQFERLMANQDVEPHFQPIVNLPDGKAVGYEVLARSHVFGLNQPKIMFLAASQLNLEAELSRLFRTVGVAAGQKFKRPLNLFLNTHPVEVMDCGLLESLRELRQNHPEQNITLEIHEAAVTDSRRMKLLRDQLNEIGIQLAYDDFGAGESRLVGLAAVRPDWVKFDMHLIRNIDKAPSSQQKMLATLVRMVREMGIATLAEGIETEQEHAVCCDLGFAAAQGFYYGRPTQAELLNLEEDTSVEPHIAPVAEDQQSVEPLETKISAAVW